MQDVFIRSLTFVLIIIMGYTLKKLKILKKEDANVLATIIMNITLPCALLTSASGIELNILIFVLICIGILSNVIMIFIGNYAMKKESGIMRGTYMLNVSGYNIGNFALAFVQSFFPGLGVVYLCSFDIGNALMGLGITYAMSSYVASGESDFKIGDLLKKLFSSIPFDVYVIIFILAIFKIPVPAFLLSITSTIGAGNSFLAMLMIGLMMELKISPTETRNVVRVITLRMIGTIVLSCITYFLLPIPILAKKILILSYFAPLSTVSAVFSKKIGYHGDMPATANSLSIIIGVLCTTLLLLIFI